MENSSFLEFKQLNPRYYTCKRCRTHIALAEDFVSYHTPEPDVAGGLFNKVFNVNIEDKPRRLKRSVWHNLIVYCKRCHCALGSKYVEVDKCQTLIKSGMVLLVMKKLVLRLGNDYLDGETMAPLPPPDHYMCNDCRSHIALATDVRHPTSQFIKAARHHTNRIVFNKAVNVGFVHDPAQLQKVGPHTFAGVYCAKCNHPLGWKMIASDDPSFTTIVQSELVELYANALLRSYGNNIVRARTITLHVG